MNMRYFLTTISNKKLNMTFVAKTEKSFPNLEEIAEVAKTRDFCILFMMELTKEQYEDFKIK